MPLINPCWGLHPQTPHSIDGHWFSAHLFWPRFFLSDMSFAHAEFSLICERIFLMIMIILVNVPSSIMCCISIHKWKVFYTRSIKKKKVILYHKHCCVKLKLYCFNFLRPCCTLVTRKLSNTIFFYTFIEIVIAP